VLGRQLDAEQSVLGSDEAVRRRACEESERDGTHALGVSHAAMLE
jgi:hypothetical protein